MIYKRSSALFAEAQKVIPGGVNSPVRAFKAVGGDPIFVEKAKGITCTFLFAFFVCSHAENMHCCRFRKI